MYETISSVNKEFVELRFSICLLPNDILRFQMWGFVGAFLRESVNLFFRAAVLFVQTTVCPCMSLILGAVT